MRPGPVGTSCLCRPGRRPRHDPRVEVDQRDVEAAPPVPRGAPTRGARIVPAVSGHIREVRIRRWLQGLPHPRPGRHLLQPALERPLGRVHLAGDYLGGVYTDTAISSGQEAALAVRAALQSADSES